MTRKPQVITDFSEIDVTLKDPFFNDELAELDALDTYDLETPKKPFSWGKLAISAFLTLFLFSFGLWIEKLIQSLFTEYSLLGWLALFVAIIGFVALIIFIAKELFALKRLEKVEHLRLKARKAVEFDDRKEAKEAVNDLIAFTAHQKSISSGRRQLTQLSEEIIDGKPLIHLAEAELLRPLDKEARILILGTAKRVSIVTAVSPRAIIDIVYVIYESSKLIRSLAELYGCRPGRFDFFRILRRVMAHLAVTGTLALSEGLVQQIIGQGLAARLSARLGEGVVNGLMTTRIGIAAMDALRPFPFDGERRPRVSDFTSDLFSSNKDNKV